MRVGLAPPLQLETLPNGSDWSGLSDGLWSRPAHTSSVGLGASRPVGATVMELCLHQTRWPVLVPLPE